MYFIEKDGTIIKEFDLKKDEQPREAVKRIHQELTSKPEEKTEESDIKKEKEIKKLINKKIKSRKILLNLFTRGVFITAKLRKDNKTYKAFHDNKDVIEYENSFYKTKLQNHILTVQHKKLILMALLNSKKIEVSKGRIITITTTRKLAVSAGFCKINGYGKETKERVLRLLEETKEAVVELTDKINKEKTIFNIVDDVKIDNNFITICFSNTFTTFLQQYTLFLPPIDFSIQNIIFDIILYFMSQNTVKSNKRIYLKTLLQTLHLSADKRFIPRYKKTLEKYKNILQKYNIYYRNADEMLEYMEKPEIEEAPIKKIESIKTEPEETEEKTEEIKIVETLEIETEEIKKIPKEIKNFITRLF